MGSLKVVKKVLVLITVFLVFFGCLISSFRIPVSAEGSNSRVQTNIKWAQEQSFQDMNVEDLGNMTYDDLKMIGVFLSNFYVPYSTGIGKSTDEDSVKESMIDALVKQCNFNKDVAEALVPMIWTMVLDTAQPLKIGVLEPDGDSNKLKLVTQRDGKALEIYTGDKKLTKDGENGEGFEANLYTFLLCASGSMNEDGQRMNAQFAGSWEGKDGGYNDEANKNAVRTELQKDENKQKHKGYKTFALYWDDADEKRVVWSNTLAAAGTYHANIFTASALTYGILNDNLNYNNGMGGDALFSVQYEDFSSFAPEQRSKAFITNAKLYVDCFGDIFVDNGVNQYVILPACENAYAWYNYDEGVESAGKYINLVNLFKLGEIANKHITYEPQTTTAPATTTVTTTTTKAKTTAKDANSADSADDGLPSAGVKHNPLGVNDLSYSVYTGDQSLFNLDCFRLYRGSSDMKVDKDLGPWGEGDETTTLRDWMWDGGEGEGYFAKVSSAEEAAFFAWDTYDYHFDWSSTSGYYTKINKKGYDPLLYKGAFQDMAMIENVGEFKKATSISSAISTIDIFNPDGSMIGEGLFGNSTNFTSVTADNAVTTLSGSKSKQYLVSIFLSYVFAFYDTRSGADRVVSWAYNADAFPKVSNAIDWSNIEIESDALQNELMSILYYFMHPSKGIELVKQWFKNKVSGILVGWHEDMVGAAGGVSTSGSTRYIGFAGYVTIPNLSDLAWTDWLLSQYDSLVVYFIILIMVVMLGYVMIGSLTLQRALTGVVIFAICAYLPPKIIDTTVNISNTVCDSIYSSKFTYWALAQHYQYQSEIDAAVKSNDEQQYLATIFEQQAENASNDYAVVTLKWQCPKKDNYLSEVKKEVNKATGNPDIFKWVSSLASSQISGESFTEAANNLYLYRSYTDVAAYSKALFKNCAGEDTSFAESIYTDKKIIGTAGQSGVGINSGYGGDYSTGLSSSELVGRVNDLLSEGSYVFKYITSSSGGRDISTERLRRTAVNNGFIFKPVLNNPDNILGCKHIFLPIVSRTVAKSIVFGDTPDAILSSSLAGMVSDPDEGSWSISAWADSTFEGRNTSGVSVETQFRDLLIGIPKQSYNTTLRMLNNGMICDPKTGDSKDVSSVDNTPLVTLDAYGLMSFGCYTESPYYYFSTNLSDQLELLKTKNSKYEGDTYKDLFLLPNSAYFYNNDVIGTNANAGDKIGEGEMRDFMDMRSLFSVIIPYLNRANQVVVDWDNTHGLWMYDDVELKFGSNNEILLPDEINPDLWQKEATDKQLTGDALEEYLGSKEDILYKYWHNANVAQLLNMYTPWVDTMYSCKYAEPENIYVAGNKFRVEDPLDPKTYCKLDSNGKIVEGREMIFSRSEMVYYGLREDDLTQVERNIIKMYDNVYEALLPLMDYYNFGNDVLNVGAAMLETFEFNKIFSESNPFGEDYTLYPQSYELKNFSYDAFLRLILAETTGEDIAASYEEDGSMYMTIVKNSSILTGIMFILVDLLAVYAIPALKLFFLLAIFALSVLVILCATIKLDISLPRVLWKSLVSPLLKFLAISVGMALAVSLFMSNGNTAVTGRGGFTISLGDPVMVLIVMLLINAIVLVLYYKTVKKVFSDCVRYAKAVAQSFTGMIGGIVAKGTDVLKAGKARVTPETVGVGGVGSAASRGLGNISRKAKAVGSNSGGSSGLKSAAFGAMAGAAAGTAAAMKAAGSKVGGAAKAGAGAVRDRTSAEGRLNKYNKKIDRYKAQDERREERKRKIDSANEVLNNENAYGFAKFMAKGRLGVNNFATKASNKRDRITEGLTGTSRDKRREAVVNKQAKYMKRVEVKTERLKSTAKMNRLKRNAKRR